MGWNHFAVPSLLRSVVGSWSRPASGRGAGGARSSCASAAADEAACFGRFSRTLVSRDIVARGAQRPPGL